MKKRGWRFVGPTTCYAFMQAMGLVNDHAPDCSVRERALAARAAFVGTIGWERPFGLAISASTAAGHQAEAGLASARFRNGHVSLLDLEPTTQSWRFSVW